MTETLPAPSKQALSYIVAQARKQPFWERDIDDVRREYRAEALATAGDPEPVAHVEEIDAHGVSARLYRPGGGEAAALVWVHGGAWIVGDLETEDALARTLANQAECAVLSVDYRLAPEYRYPAALDDSWTATLWAAEHFDAIAIGGDSAGGNLSAAVALRARDRGLKLALQLLVYPVLDYRVDSASYQEYRDRYEHFAGLEGFGAEHQESIRQVWNGYIPVPAQRCEPSASPLRAASFSGMAPALIITAEHDILRGEADEYACRIKFAGVPAEVLNYEGQVHGFYRLLGIMEDARDAVGQSATALRRAFSW